MKHVCINFRTRAFETSVDLKSKRNGKNRKSYAKFKNVFGTPVVHVNLYDFIILTSFSYITSIMEITVIGHCQNITENTRGEFWKGSYIRDLVSLHLFYIHMQNYLKQNTCRVLLCLYFNYWFLTVMSLTTKHVHIFLIFILCIMKKRWGFNLFSHLGLRLEKASAVHIHFISKK